MDTKNDHSEFSERRHVRAFAPWTDHGLKACGAAKNDRAAIEERLNNAPGIMGWTVGECVLRCEERGINVCRVYDKECREHWLYLGPWSEWQRVSELWSHLETVNRILMDISPLFYVFGSMLPGVRWLKTSEGFLALSERRAYTPYFQLLSEHNLPARFENIVQLTGFLRLLQLGDNVFSNGNSHKIVDELEQRTLSLIKSVEERVPQKARYARWQSFLLQNAKSISYSGRLVLSLGPFAPGCIAYTERAALLIDFPFLLSEDLEHSDLCRLLFVLRKQYVQDRQCLIDSYFNRDVPCQFFSLLAHQQIVFVLEALRASTRGSGRESYLLREFENLSQEYERFRSPVPHWYKYY